MSRDRSKPQREGEIFVSGVLADRIEPEGDAGVLTLHGVRPPVVWVEPGATHARLRSYLYVSVMLDRVRPGAHALRLVLRDEHDRQLYALDIMSMESGTGSQVGARIIPLDLQFPATATGLQLAVQVDGRDRFRTPLKVRTLDASTRDAEDP